MDRMLIIAGALLGALGIITSSMSAHIETAGQSLNIAANFLLFHAPLLMLLPLLVRNGLTRPRITYLGSIAVLIGVSLFSGELVLRTLAERTLFFMAAPTGGVILISGWLIIALSAVFIRRHAEIAR